MAKRMTLPVIVLERIVRLVPVNLILTTLARYDFITHASWLVTKTTPDKIWQNGLLLMMVMMDILYRYTRDNSDHHDTIPYWFWCDRWHQHLIRGIAWSHILSRHVTKWYHIAITVADFPPCWRNFRIDAAWLSFSRTDACWATLHASPFNLYHDSWKTIWADGSVSRHRVSQSVVIKFDT